MQLCHMAVLSLCCAASLRLADLCRREEAARRWGVELSCRLQTMQLQHVKVNYIRLVVCQNDPVVDLMEPGATSGAIN